MRTLICVICLILIYLGPPPSNCQERGGLVRVRVRNEHGTPQAAETPVYTESHALLIGNSAYDDSAWSDLPDVAEDLAAVKEVLEEQHGFNVEVALNQNHDALVRVISQFINRYGQRYNSRVLIYYSGHGYTALLPDERRMGYLVMPDAPAMPPEEEALRTPPSEEEFERFLPSAITMDEIETYARRITARHALFVFDSCFSGTVLYKDLGAGVPNEITTEELKPVRAYLTAGNETQRVPAFSKFRRKFVAGLLGDADTNGDGYILASELGRWVSIEVEKDTGRRQTPVFGKDDLFRRGDMIFVSPRGPAYAPAAAATPTPPTALPRNAEQMFWPEIEKRNSIAAYKTYLSTYPKGEYAGVAELRIENLAWESFKPLARSLMKYDSVGQLSNDLALVSLKGKYGYIDQTGREVIPLKFGNAGRFSERFAWVWVDGKWGAIDRSGDYIIAPKYADSWGNRVSNAPIFSEGIALVHGAELSGFVDTLGREVTEFKYVSGGLFSEGLASARLNGGGCGFIDSSGKEVIPFEYEFCWEFSQGVAQVRQNGSIHYIDKTGRQAAPPKYPYLNGSEEATVVMSYGNRKYGVVDKTGRELVPFKYDMADQFSGGLARVYIGRKTGLVDKTGKELAPVKYDDIWCLSFAGDGFVGVKLGGRKGFVDIYGNEYFDL